MKHRTAWAWALGLALTTSILLLAQDQRRSSDKDLLMDGHVHITTRTYFEEIDPWTPQPVGPFDYARARVGGANVVIENLGPYGYEDYNGIVKQVGRPIGDISSHRRSASRQDEACS